MKSNKIYYNPHNDISILSRALLEILGGRYDVSLDVLIRISECTNDQKFKTYIFEIYEQAGRPEYMLKGIYHKLYSFFQENMSGRDHIHTLIVKCLEEETEHYFKS